MSGEARTAKSDDTAVLECVDELFVRADRRRHNALVYGHLTVGFYLDSDRYSASGKEEVCDLCNLTRYARVYGGGDLALSLTDTSADTDRVTHLYDGTSKSADMHRHRDRYRFRCVHANGGNFVSIFSVWNVNSAKRKSHFYSTFL